MKSAKKTRFNVCIYIKRKSIFFLINCLGYLVIVFLVLTFPKKSFVCEWVDSTLTEKVIPCNTAWRREGVWMGVWVKALPKERALLMRPCYLHFSLLYIHYLYSFSLSFCIICLYQFYLIFFLSFTLTHSSLSLYVSIIFICLYLFLSFPFC